MQKVAFGVVALIALAGPAEAAKVRFEGGAVITSVSGTCKDYNPTGNRFHTRFRPAGVGDNGNWSGLSFFQLNGAMSFAIDNGSFTSSFKTVTYGQIYDNAWGGDFPVQVKFTKQSPATIATTTQFVNITGAITNFDSMKGCTANFNAALVKRLE